MAFSQQEDSSCIYEKIEYLENLLNSILSLTVYRKLLQSEKAPVTCGFINLLYAICDTEAMVERDIYNLWGELCNLLVKNERLDSFPSALADEVIRDENPFTKAVASGEFDDFEKGKISKHNGSLANLAQRDLLIFYWVSKLTPEYLLEVINEKEKPTKYDLPTWGMEDAQFPLKFNFPKCIEFLSNYYKEHGYGKFVDTNAFYWRNEKLYPVLHPDPIRLENLKEYEYQRKVVKKNTLSFLNGYAANNILLYGDRGTGKSSTVKAVLNEFSDRGLRLVEIPKNTLYQLPELTEVLSKSPMKFIIFIDDLSFSEDDEDFSMLKAVLEGGISALPKNVIIYATSNRRHLVKELHSSRDGNEVHRADTIQETVSLSDRFGIALTYLMPNKREFLDIVWQMAQDEGIDIEKDKLERKAERWALERGGRSPRYGRQFITHIKTKELTKEDGEKA